MIKFFEKLLIFSFIGFLLFPQLLSAQDVQARVSRVIDGDTIVLSNGERVRLIGVDTPELHHPNKPVQFFAKEAYEFTKELLEGKEVNLEYDKEKKDKYGRTLSYVYLLDGTFVNAEIIKQGYGFAYTRFPFKYKERFLKLQTESIQGRRGIWYFLLYDPETNQLLRKYHSLPAKEREELIDFLDFLITKSIKGGKDEKIKGK